MTGPVFRRAKIRTRKLDDTMTPLEIAALLQSRTYSHMPFAIAPLLERGPPVGYRCYNISEHVRLYSADRGAPNLIVAFAGGVFRLMVSISYFLQMMQDDVYDILLLTDITRRHFEGGIDGYSSSLLETADRVKAFVEARAYRKVIAYGTSMGGFPALRAGLQFGADRAISVGGGFCVHPPRLVESEHEIRAFDLLCACRPMREISLFAVFAVKHEGDAGHHAILRQLLPNCVMMEIDVPSHNVLHHLDMLGELQSFYATVFDSV